MSVRQVIIPHFSLKQLNKSAIENGKGERTRLELEQEEMASAVHAFDSVNNTDDAIFLCVRKALPDGDFQYGIMITLLDSEVLEVNLPNFDLKTTVITNNKRGGIGEIVQRVLKNVAFT